MHAVPTQSSSPPSVARQPKLSLRAVAQELPRLEPVQATPSSEQSAAEQRVTEQRVTEQRVTEQRAAEQRAAEQRVTEPTVSKQPATEQPTTEQTEQLATPAAEADSAEKPASATLAHERAMTDISADIRPPAGPMPGATAEEILPGVEPAWDGPWMRQAWGASNVAWAPTALCHRPLYFEELGLERHGHTVSPILQPAFSGAHFLACVAILPYKAGIEHPWECIYTLGHYRPGSPAPRLRYRPPWQVNAAVLQGAAVTGLVFGVP